jgi:hypothetical protein
MATYNGHKNYNHWNVSLWLGNDEGLYRMAKHYIRRADRRINAASSMIADLVEMGLTHTPDGVRYTIASVNAAMKDL